MFRGVFILWKKFWFALSPLLFEEDNRLSMASFWITLLLIYSFSYWIIGQDIPSTAFQVLMLFLGYKFSIKTVNYGKSSFERYIDTKTTPELLKYRAEAAKAAKDVDSNIG